jgi:PncC family amidohydrolase
MKPQIPTEALSAALLQRGWMLTCAESCTGGLISAGCTDLAGSSLWFERGFVSYSNEAKQTMLGVPAALIAQHGAVSEPVAQAMVLGALNHSKAQVALAVTGIAGPGGGSVANSSSVGCGGTRGMVERFHTPRIMSSADSARRAKKGEAAQARASAPSRASARRRSDAMGMTRSGVTVAGP